MSTKEIESKARRLKILKNKQEVLQQEIDQLEGDLKAQLEAWNVEEVQAGPFRVVWKLVNSNRFDSKSFQPIGYSRTIPRDRLQNSDLNKKSAPGSLPGLVFTRSPPHPQAVSFRLPAGPPATSKC